jgi:hypothetical protein
MSLCLELHYTWYYLYCCCFRAVSQNAAYALRPLLTYCPFRIRVLTIPDSSTISGSNLQAPGSETGETSRGMALIFPYLLSLSYSAGLLAWGKLLRHGIDGFTSLSPLKIHRSQPGLNPRILSPMASMITARSPRACY